MPAYARTIALAIALSVLCRAHAVRGDEGDDLFRSAAKHYAQGEWEAACEDFAKLLDTAADHERSNPARFHYGEALVQLGRYAEARRQFDALLARDPDHRFAPQALFRSGEAAYLAADRAAARRLFGEFGQRYPDAEANAYVLAHLGRLELDDGQPAKAVAHFAAAIERYPDGPLSEQCRLGLAESQERLKRPDEARGGYQSLVDDGSPLADYAALHLAALDNEQGDHAAALARLERLEKDLPTSALADKARLGRGYALYKLERYDESEAALAGLTSHARLGVDAHYWQGMSQSARKAWKEAAATFLAGAAIDPKHRLSETLTYHAARALFEGGQFQAAAGQFDRLLERWPASDWADECWLGKLQAAAAREDYAACVRLAGEFDARFPASPLRSDVEAAKGRALTALGNHAEAAAALERSLAKMPAGEPSANSPENAAPQDAKHRAAQAELAMSYARLNRFDDATRIVQSMYEQSGPDADTEETVYQIAERALAAEQLDTAGELFALLVLPGSSSEATRRGLLGQGWCRFKASDWLAAADAFGRLLEKFPSDPSAAEATLMRGRALEHVGDATGALAMYRQLVDRHPNDARAADALYRAARLCDETQDTSAAVELYARLVKDHPTFAEIDAAIYRRAWLMRDSDPAAANELFARLRRDSPNGQYTPDATLRLAERAVSEKQYDLARKLLVEVTLAEAPAAVRQSGLYLLGRVAAAGEQWPEVETNLARLIDEAPASDLVPSAAYLRAEASYRQGRYEEAVQRLAALAAAQAGDQPWAAAAQLRRAQALAQLKRWDEALEVARAIGVDFPDVEQRYEADYVIGRCLAAKAEFSAAREAYARVIASPGHADSETSAMAQWMTGETYFHQENYPAALAEYQKVDKNYPFARWRAVALLQSGKCQEHLGQWEQAVAAYQRMLKEFPESELAAEAARRAEAARDRVARRAPPPN